MGSVPCGVGVVTQPPAGQTQDSLLGAPPLCTQCTWRDIFQENIKDWIGVCSASPPRRRRRPQQWQAVQRWALQPIILHRLWLEKVVGPTARKATLLLAVLLLMINAASETPRDVSVYSFIHCFFVTEPKTLMQRLSCLLTDQEGRAWSFHEIAPGSNRCECAAQLQCMPQSGSLAHRPYATSEIHLRFFADWTDVMHFVYCVNANEKRNMGALRAFLCPSVLMFAIFSHRQNKSKFGWIFT